MPFKLIFCLAVLAQFGFASKAIFIKLAYAASSNLVAIDFLALRMLFSLPLFILLGWWSRTGKLTPLTRRDWLMMLWLAFCGYYLASYLDFIGLQYISAALERVILFTNPTIVVILSALFLNKPITRRTVLALALSYSGIVLAYWHDLQTTADSQALMVGSAWILASAFCYALYLIGGSQTTKRVGSGRFTAYVMLMATGFVIGQFVLTRPIEALSQPDRVYWLGVGVAICATVLPVWMMAEALKHLGASDTAMIGSIGPVFTIGLGVVFLGEAVSLIQIIGVCLTVLGVLLISKKPKLPALVNKETP
jgi:drug/metabolite transporter (DMT)-like permease